MGYQPRIQPDLGAIFPFHYVSPVIPAGVTMKQASDALVAAFAPPQSRVEPYIPKRKQGLIIEVEGYRVEL